MKTVRRLGRETLGAVVLLVMAASAQDYTLYNGGEQKNEENCTAGFQTKIVCYISASNSQYNYDSLGPGLCTNYLLIDLIGLTEEGKLLLLQPTSRALTQFSEFKQRLRSAGDPARFSLAVGGVHQKSSQISKAVGDPEKMQDAVDNLLNFAIKHYLDGLDIAWFYPGQFGGRKADKANLCLFLQQLYLRTQACGMILSLTVGVDPRDIEISYDVQCINTNVDFVNFLTGDYHDPRKPSHVSPLYPGESRDKVNIHSSVAHYSRNGLDRQKIVCLVSNYGYRYIMRLCDKGGRSVVKNVQKLSKLAVRENIEREGYTSFWDDTRMVPYATMSEGNIKKWITFNDMESHKRKAEYVKDQQLCGIGIFTIDQDDYDGFACGIPYPSLWAIVNVINPYIDYEEPEKIINQETPVFYIPGDPHADQEASIDRYFENIPNGPNAACSACSQSQPEFPSHEDVPYQLPPDGCRSCGAKSSGPLPPVEMTHS